MNNIIKTVIEEIDTTIFELQGDAVYIDMKEGIDEFYNGKLTKYAIFDFEKLKKHLSSDEITLIAKQMSTLGKVREHGFDFIIVPTLLQYGLGRMYYAYFESSDPIALKTKVMRSREEAIKWIRNNIAHPEIEE